jgi:hypothetical protein
MNARVAQAAADWLVLATTAFLASAAGRLRASRRPVSAGCGRPYVSLLSISESANGIAATRLAVVVCAPH